MYVPNVCDATLLPFGPTALDMTRWVIVAVPPPSVLMVPPKNPKTLMGCCGLPAGVCLRPFGLTHWTTATTLPGNEKVAELGGTFASIGI